MWYYQKGNSQKGPVSEEAVKSLVDAGEIGRETLVWKEGMSEWKQISTTELGNEIHFVTPPPVRALTPSRAPGRTVSSDQEVERLENKFTAFWVCLAAGVPLSIIFIGLGGVIASGVLFFVMLYKFWDTIQDGDARTTPGKAVGFWFIPFFNLYWVFVAFHGLMQDMNKYVEERGISAPRINEGLGLAYAILASCSLIPYLGILAGVAASLVWVLGTKQIKDTTVGILKSRAV